MNEIFSDGTFLQTTITHRLLDPPAKVGPTGEDYALISCFRAAIRHSPFVRAAAHRQLYIVYILVREDDLVTFWLWDVYPNATFSKVSQALADCKHRSFPSIQPEPINETQS